MTRALPTRPFVLQVKAPEAAGLTIGLAGRVRASLKPIANQVIRSASSVPANIAEGSGRFGRDRVHHWRIAYGSAKEVDVHLRLLLHAHAVDQVAADKALNQFDEVRAMLWRLIHPRA